jgi:hypothetical protein
MRLRNLMMSTALVTPALFLALASCSDSNQEPLVPDAPDLGSPSSPAAPSARKFGLTDHKVLLPQLSAAAEANAAQLDLADAVAATDVIAATTTFARHDPIVQGLRVRCIDGSEFGFGPATSDPFRPQGDQTRGCEVNSMAGGAAIVLPGSNSTRGKLVRNTRRLEFYYAGGPQNGGAPRFSLFTDFCKADAAVQPTTGGGPIRSCPGGHTDGEWDETLFIDQSNCNDGDPFVGAVLLKSSPNSASDATCPIFEAFGADGASGTGDEHVHTNWFDYIGAHPNDRFAVHFGAANDFARADNFIIVDVPVHYLIYRVRMQGGTT